VRDDGTEFSFILKVMCGEDHAVAAHQLGCFKILDLGSENDKTRREDEKLVAFYVKTARSADDIIFIVHALNDISDVFAVKLFRHFEAKGGGVFVFWLSFQEFEHKITSLGFILA